MAAPKGGSRRPIRKPSIPLPRLPAVPRNPRGWNATEISIRRRAAKFVNRFEPQEPAGEVPGWMKAKHPTMSKPEWAVWWGLLKAGKQPEFDFIYLAHLPGVGASLRNQVDFLLPYERLVIEVQGEYWHYGVGSEKEAIDLLRRLAFVKAGYRVVFIDESDAIRRPDWIVKEALLGVDHSRAGSKR